MIPSWRQTSVSLFWLASLALVLAGCRSPFQTVMRGAMRMSGGMNMNGEIKTVMKSDNTASRLATVPVYANPSCQSSGCIAILDVDGLLLNKNVNGLGSMGENPVALFREKLDALASNPNLAGIVLRINSPGGGVAASDMMARDLLQLKQQRGIPVVACLMDVGAGGGYYLATTADHILAHPTSVVGGIGVIFNAYRLDDMPSFSIQSVPVKAGSKVDMGTPSRRQSDEERALLQDMANEFHQRFIDRVVTTRGITSGTQIAEIIVPSPAEEVADEDEEFEDEFADDLIDPAVAEREKNLNPILDGRVVSGLQALEAELIDEVGYLDDAVLAARQLAGLPEDSPLVMLRRDNDRAYTLLDVTPNTPTVTSIVPLKIPGLDRSELPNFLYLWQPEPSLASGT